MGVRSLAPGESIFENGIKYTKLPNGDGRFSINLMVDGRRIQRALGKESEGVTRSDAELFIEQMRTESRQNRYNLPQGRKLAMSFEEVSQKYLERLKQIGDADLKKKESRLKLHLLPFFSGRPLNQIKNFDIQRFVHTRSESGAKNSTINRELAVLSHLTNRAIEWGWIPERPFEIKLLKEDKVKDAYLLPDECEALLKAAKVHSRELYLFVKIGLSTGMRLSNILSIEIENIDFKTHYIYLPKTKNGAHDQPITSELAEYLAFYLKNYCTKTQKWLFPSNNSSTGHRVCIRESFRTAVKNAGLNPDIIVRHTLRHTVVSTLVQRGVDNHTIMDITGHRTEEMIRRYSHRDKAHVKNALNKLESVMPQSSVVRLKPVREA